MCFFLVVVHRQKNIHLFHKMQIMLCFFKRKLNYANKVWVQHDLLECDNRRQGPCMNTAD